MDEAKTMAVWIAFSVTLAVFMAVMSVCIVILLASIVVSAVCFVRRHWIGCVVLALWATFASAATLAAQCVGLDAVLVVEGLVLALVLPHAGGRVPAARAWFRGRR